MLTPEQLRAISRLEALAKKELEKYPQGVGSFHNADTQMLMNVPTWARHVREGHDNPFTGKDEIEGCLENLRKVARRFKFNLKEK